MIRATRFFREMKNGFRQSWFGFLFKYTDLGQLLNQDTPPFAVDFFLTYINSWWWNRLWFRSKINSRLIYDFDKINNILTSLGSLYGLSKEN